MNSETNDAPINQPTALEAMREALAAARESLKASQAVADETGVIKASRAVADVAARIARLESVDEDQPHQPNSKEEREFLEALIVALEGTEKDRQKTIASLRTGMGEDKVY